MIDLITKKKILVSFVIFLVFYLGGMLFYVANGAMTGRILILGAFISLLFALVMFFVMDDSWFLKTNIHAVAAVKNESVKKLKLIYGLGIILFGVILLIMFFTANLRKPLIGMLVFVGLVYSFIQYRLSGAVREGTVTQQQKEKIDLEINSGIKRGVWGGVVFVGLIVIFLIIYFFIELKI